jgi:hypothetical protein
MEKMSEKSIAYEIYKKNVGGITFNGEKMKEFYELPEKIKNAWLQVEFTLLNKENVKVSENFYLKDILP